MVSLSAIIHVLLVQFFAKWRLVDALPTLSLKHSPAGVGWLCNLLGQREVPVPSVCCCKPWQCQHCVVGSHEPSCKGLAGEATRRHCGKKPSAYGEALRLQWEDCNAFVESTLQSSLPKHHTFEGSRHSCSSLALSHCKCLRNYREGQQRPHPAEARKHRILRIKSMFWDTVLKFLPISWLGLLFYILRGPSWDMTKFFLNKNKNLRFLCLS